MSPDSKTLSDEATVPGKEKIIEEKERVKWEIYDLLGTTLARLNALPPRDERVSGFFESEVSESEFRGYLKDYLAGLRELVREGGVESEDFGEGGNLFHLRFYDDSGLSLSSLFGLDSLGHKHLVFRDISPRKECLYIREGVVCSDSGIASNVLFFEVIKHTGETGKDVYTPYVLPPIDERII